MSLRTSRLILSLLFLAVLATWLIVKGTTTTCQENYRHNAQITTGQNRIAAEIARSPEQLEKGLGGRKCISDNQGMLFVFDKAGIYPFWMKDMKFPIDIIWIDSDRQVLQVNVNVSPKTYPKTFVSEQPAAYVLELKAGEAEKLNIIPGSMLELHLH